MGLKPFGKEYSIISDNHENIQSPEQNAKQRSFTLIFTIQPE